MRSVTLDTNEYISALQYGGAVARLLGMARAGMIRIDVSDAILDELTGVLRDKFGWDGYRLQDARQKITRIANRVTSAQRLNVITEDPADNRILECALDAGSDCIVTEDKDLLRRGAYEGIQIMRSSEFLRTPEPGRER